MQLKSRRAKTSGIKWYEEIVAGKFGQPGAALDPLSKAPVDAAEVNRTRPATTRYPISLEAYLELKTKSVERKPPTKRTAHVVVDKMRPRPDPAALVARGPQPGAVASLAVSAAPVPGLDFAGISATQFEPPDCTLAAGSQHALAAVNSSLAIIDKTSGKVAVQKTLTAWFSNVVSSAKIFDPKALYDQFEARWILIAVALHETESKSWFLISVSKTDDPTGSWLNYALDATKDGASPTNNWADYPCLGLDSQAVYLTANMFRFGGGFQYAKLRIIPKTALYAGGAITFKDIVGIQDGTGVPAFTVQPCHTFGAPQMEYLIASRYPTSSSPTQQELTLFSLTDPLGSPALAGSPVRVDPYALPPPANQKGGGTLDTGDVRLLNAVFRGGSVWTALTTNHDFGEGNNVATCHWFQLDASGRTLQQQGIYGAKGKHYFYPMVMPDTNGNMVMVFCRSATNEFGSIYYTGRRTTDPVGTLQGSSMLKAGTTHYAGSRWGDYNGISIDSADNRMVWFHSEFADAANNWATWIGSARF